MQKPYQLTSQLTKAKDKATEGEKGWLRRLILYKLDVKYWCIHLALEERSFAEWTLTVTSSSWKVEVGEDIIMKWLTTSDLEAFPPPFPPHMTAPSPQRTK